MAATYSDISRWFDQGKERGATHMLVACDTFDYEDYPVYVTPDQDVRDLAKQNDGPNMTRLMEVYSLSMDKDAQLRQHRAFNY